MTKPDAPVPAPAPAPKPARRGRPSKDRAAGTADTRDSILDAAEDLFSKHGFYGVTIREVAREAGVDTALVHYYFGAKRSLFDAVFLRRAEVWNAERVDAINRYAQEAGPDGMTFEGLFEAFLRPPFVWSLKGGPGWKHGGAAADRTDQEDRSGCAGGRPLLGLSQPVGRADADAGRDRAAGSPVGRPVPVGRSGQRL